MSDKQRIPNPTPRLEKLREGYHPEQPQPQKDLPTDTGGDDFVPYSGIEREDVRVCKCHPGIYWRRMGPQNEHRVRAGGFATRHGFSGNDLVNAFMFEPAEWEAMERA